MHFGTRANASLRVFVSSRRRNRLILRPGAGAELDGGTEEVKTGSTLRPYEFVAPLGCGGMGGLSVGTVSLSPDRPLARLHVLKH
jgi:hypothetical protein